VHDPGAAELLGQDPVRQRVVRTDIRHVTPANSLGSVYSSIVHPDFILGLTCPRSRSRPGGDYSAAPMSLRPLTAPPLKVLIVALFFMPVRCSDVVGFGGIALHHIQGYWRIKRHFFLLLRFGAVSF